ncbi:MAG TPA: glycosyltransferase family 1 protein, partial [Phycisphaerales bacterium]|nr:glycosyltransferase family 1 protein [Phycisphaerales bacterium]
MKIMHVSTRLILGGSQENTVLSCAGQADDGHEVLLVFGPIEGPEGTMLPAVEAHGGITPVETPDLVREIAPRRDWRCLGNLRRLIREHQPDVVHTHSSKAGILGREAAWRESVPAGVHTIHGLPFHPYLAKSKNAVYIAAERWSARRCHAIVTVADAMRDQALAAGIGRRTQYRTVRSGMLVEPYL